MPNFTAFFSLVVLSTFTPGPNNIMALTNATKHGFRKALPFNWGVFTGFILVISLAALFSASLYIYLPAISPYIKLAGCAYIFHLAWKTYKATGCDTGEEARLGFFTAVTLQFLNIKLVVYAIAVMSTFITPYYHTIHELLVFTLVLSAIGLVSTCCWSLFGAFFQKILNSHEKLLNTVMALMLIYCGVSLFM